VRQPVPPGRIAQFRQPLLVFVLFLFFVVVVLVVAILWRFAVFLLGGLGATFTRVVGRLLRGFRSSLGSPAVLAAWALDGTAQLRIG
jgi:hypothetical protein